MSKSSLDKQALQHRALKASIAHVTHWNGLRSSTATGYLDPIKEEISPYFSTHTQRD